MCVCFDTIDDRLKNRFALAKEPAVCVGPLYFFPYFLFPLVFCFHITIKRPISAFKGRAKSVHCTLINICNILFFGHRFPTIYLHVTAMKIAFSFIPPFYFFFILFRFDIYLQALCFRPSSRAYLSNTRKKRMQISVRLYLKNMVVGRRWCVLFFFFFFFVYFDILCVCIGRR